MIILVVGLCSSLAHVSAMVRPDHFFYHLSLTNPVGSRCFSTWGRRTRKASAPPPGCNWRFGCKALKKHHATQMKGPDSVLAHTEIARAPGRFSGWHLGKLMHNFVKFI